MGQVAHVKLNDGTYLRCLVPAELAIHNGDHCIFQTDKMLDSGIVEGLDSAEDRKCDQKCDQKCMPSVVRCATLQDQSKVDENSIMGKIALDSCNASIEKHSLEMRLINVRYSFDRAVLVVRFSSEDRVDFREMVKDLASELRTRIEMIQVGVRDEAGIVGGMGICGRELCCCSWLEKFESINVKMAKAQKLSLNPAGISGMCGRLKCCLKYEADQYRELGRHLPKEGSTLHCPDGEKGRVQSVDVLGQKVRVRFDDDRVRDYSAEELNT